MAASTSLGRSEGAADPPAVRQNVVCFCLPGGQYLAPYRARERNVDQRSAVEVTDLAATKPVLSATEAMRLDGHALEIEHRRPDAFTCPGDAHASRRCQSQNSCTAWWKGIGSGRPSSRRDFERSQYR